MIVKVKFQIGKVEYEFQFDEKDEKDTLNKAITLSQPPVFCEVCSSEGKDAKNPEDFKLTTNKDKEGNIYVNVKHRCGARVKLGEYKVGGYFWKQPFERYEAKKETQNGQE